MFRSLDGIGLSPPSQSQSTLITHQRPPSNQSWMLLIPRAKVGFLLQTDRTDSAEFKVFVKGDPSDFASKLCFYDGRLDELVLDLERYAGKDVELVLQVRVLDTVTRHLAVWVDPRIEW